MRYISIFLAFLFSVNIAFAEESISPFYFYANGTIISCYPPNAGKNYEKRYRKEFEECRWNLEQVQRSIRYYKKQYDKCQKKNRYEDWCIEYGQKYEEYRSMLK